METELRYLYCSLVFSFVFAPMLTNTFFLNNSKSYRNFHVLSLIIVVMSILLDIGFLTIAWPLFNLYGLFLHYKNKRINFFNFINLATFIPFTFSIIASIWLVAGSNDLYLLGYDINWSFYAALHGNFLGWIFLGCLAHLSTTNIRFARLYAYGCYISFILFLLIAFGIDGVPYIKKIGVVGLTLLIPFFIGLYSFTCKNKNSMYLSFINLLVVFFSMTLAAINEFGTINPQYLSGVRSMVAIHGVLNAFIVTPFFFFSIKLDQALIE